MTRQRIASVLDGRGKTGRVVVLSIQGLILLSLVTFSIDTLPDLTDGTRRWLRIIEVITVAIFTLEYLLRIVVAEKPLRFVFSFFGLVDLLSILPFYIATGFDLRSLRVVRVLRLFRVLKLMRYSRAMRRFGLALRLAREELVLFMAVAAIVTYLSAVGIYYFENAAQPEHYRSVFHSLWWSIISLTTVGYGDMYPVTVGGKVFTSVVLVVGLGIVAVPTGILSSALSEARRLEGGGSPGRGSSHGE